MTTTYNNSHILPWNHITGDRLRIAFSKSIDALCHDGNASEDIYEMSSGGGDMDRAGLLTVEHTFTYQGYLDSFLWAMCGQSYPHYLARLEKQPLTVADAKLNTVTSAGLKWLTTPHNDCTDLKQYLVSRLIKISKMIHSHKDLQMIINYLYDTALDSSTFKSYLINIGGKSLMLHNISKMIVDHKTSIKTDYDLRNPNRIIKLTYSMLNKMCYYLWQIIPTLDTKFAY